VYDEVVFECVADVPTTTSARSLGRSGTIVLHVDLNVEFAALTTILTKSLIILQ
jgi:hypothetical protein